MVEVGFNVFSDIIVREVNEKVASNGVRLYMMRENDKRKY